MKIEQLQRRGGNRYTKFSLPPVHCSEDLIGDCKRSPALVLTHFERGNRPFDKIPHFKINTTGMAFPELLRAYAELFTRAADYIEGKEPIDFQI